MTSKELYLERYASFFNKRYLHYQKLLDTNEYTRDWGGELEAIKIQDHPKVHAHILQLAEHYLEQATYFKARRHALNTYNTNQLVRDTFIHCFKKTWEGTSEKERGEKKGRRGERGK